MQEIISLCRPVEGVVYCDRCCNRSGGGCFMHGDLEDGTRGCRGWHEQRFQGVTQSLGCQDFLCWDPERLKDAEIQQQLRLFFTHHPLGRYNAEEVLDKFNLRRQRETNVSPFLASVAFI